MISCSITPLLQAFTCDTLQNKNDICIINVSECITLAHSGVVPSRWIVFTLSAEPLVKDCSYFSLIAVSLSLPLSLSSLLISFLIKHHSHTLGFHASSFTLTLSLSPSLLASLSLIAPVIMPHPSLSLCPLLRLSAFVYIYLH